MDQSNIVDLKSQAAQDSAAAFDGTLREGARRLLQAAIEAEVADYIDKHQHLRNPHTGHRLVVRNGKLPDGTKELVAIHDGERESKQSWLELLRDLKRRGLSHGPELCTGDGALGFWSALEEVLPKVRQQRCWVHKTANVLDKLPNKVQPHAKKLIQEMYLAETKVDALAAYEEFFKLYQAKYPKASACLATDKDALFAFYDFPAKHWAHIRTTNPIESAFATVRHRTRQTKGSGSRMAGLTMAFKLAREAEKHWRRLNGSELLPKVIQGVRFVDGIEIHVA